jgi:hypothetical protein
MTQSEFHDRWTRAFPHASPVGWLVRMNYESHWTRLHTLPEGRRTPQGPQDMEEVVRRIEAVVEEVIGAGKSVDVVVPASVRRHDPSTLPPDFAMLDPAPLDPVPGPPTDLEDEGEDDDDDEEEYEDEPLYLWHARTLWRPGLLSTTFREVASGALGSVLLFGPRRNVVSPYEGGVDVLAPNDILGRVRKRFRAWRSDRPDGL